MRPRLAGEFETLFRGTGAVDNGFPTPIDLASLEHRTEYDAEMLRANLMLGRPEEAIAKLKRYRDLGVDNFIYYSTFGLPMELQKKSLKLVITEVLPEFSKAKGGPVEAAPKLSSPKRMPLAAGNAARHSG